jgi:Mg-chelatase subunit ChlD
MLAALGACVLGMSSCAAEEPSSGGTLPLGAAGAAGQPGAVAGGPGGAGGVAASVGGGTGGAVGNLGGGTGGVTANPNGVCETRTINAYEGAPDILIVLDRSESMQLYGRWNPSKMAVKTITTDFGGLINFGLSSFPGEMGACSAGKLEVPLMINNAGPIGTWLGAARTNGFTPTGPALTEALKILGDRNAGLDTSTKPAYVVLVTDGEPTCQGIPTIPGIIAFPDQMQQDNAKAAVKALKAANIPTYVIGYQIDVMWQPLMNELAQLGGTEKFRSAESADQVVTTFREITKDVVKCSFELAEAPVNPKFVRVEIDKKTVALDAADGWVVNGKTVTLQGGSCATLKDGKGHLLNAQVECNEIVLN